MIFSLRSLIFVGMLAFISYLGLVYAEKVDIIMPAPRWDYQESQLLVVQSIRFLLTLIIVATINQFYGQYIRERMTRLLNPRK